MRSRHSDDMEALKLDAKLRTVTGKQVKNLRKAGSVPAVMYGHGTKPTNLAVESRAFDKVFAKAGESSLVDLAIDGGAGVKVLIQDVQHDVLRDTVSHIDFRAVNMNEKLEADVAFKFVGESPAVKASGAILVRAMDAVTVRCLPNDLVHEIEIDLSTLANVDDRITIGDLAALNGIEFMAGPEEVIVVVNAPISEEELAALDAKTDVDVSAVKVGTDEKKAERAAAKEADAEAKE